MPGFLRARRAYGAGVGAGATLVVVGLGLIAGAGTAASNAAPTNISPPTISGTPRQGEVLTGDRGNWTGAPTDYDYTWTRCNQSGAGCSDIDGAHGTTYTPAESDVGHTIRLEVVAKNADGQERQTSAPTAVIAPGAPRYTKPPTISGTARQGNRLSGNEGSWSGRVADYDDVWLRCNESGGNCSAIKNAAGKSYVLTAADVGKTIRFQVTAKNASGSTTTVSVPTAVVVTSAKRPENRSAPKLSGNANVGQVVTMSNGEWKNAPTSYAYQWLRCDRNGGNCVAIAGAFGPTWRVTQTSVGHTLRGRVTAKNSAGSTEAVSAPTRVVGGAPAPPPPAPAGCPTGTGSVDVGSIGPPARLLIDRQVTIPAVVRGGTPEFIVRYHVSACGGRSARNALVYTTAVPYNQWTIPAEQRTDGDGWAEIRFRRLSGFPVSSRQQLIAIFTRARKSGESVLGGISTRRLFSADVSLRG